VAPGEIVSLTFFERDGRAVITFADGGIDKRLCSLWQASEWSEAAGLSIVVAMDETFHWELLDQPREARD
jgi:hypothetical protein